MNPVESVFLANELSISAVRLIRWLRMIDPSPSLSGPEASAMAVIVYSDGISPSKLAELERVQRPTISRTLSGLIERGLVERKNDPQDKRSSTIVATDEGQTLWNAGQRRQIAPLIEGIASLSEDEQDTLAETVTLLNRLINLEVD